MSSTDSSPASTTSPPASFFSGGGSLTLVMGLVGVGAFALGVITLCAWRSLTGRDPLDIFAAMGPRRRNVQGREQWEQQQADDDAAGGKPEMFNAWTEQRTTDILKWEESMPFSAMVVKDYLGTQHTSKDIPGVSHDNVHGEEENGKQQSRISNLQVAILLAMPSPHRAKGHNDVNEEPTQSSFQEELAIGLIEVPWTRENDDPLDKAISIS
ncbi:hypothetical protein BJV78DRAFT_1282688 [Lactifluus subvellereus]|nr:hypothetical protein BJV78DRAFT_1282688 [Lactifluus subvellereus]